MSHPFQLALLQMRVEGGEPARNLARAEALIRDAAAGGAECVVLPEAMDVGWTHPASRTLAEPIPDGAACRRLSAAARKHQVYRLWITGVSNVGWISDGPWKGRRTIGCSLLIGPQGEEVLQGPYGVEAETVLYADVTPVARPARGCGWEEYWKG